MVNTPSLALTPDEWLSLIGWLLSFAGQVLVTARHRAGLAVWMASSALLAALGLHTGRLLTTLMFATNFIWCAWSYLRWTGEHGAIRRRLFDGLARR